MFEPLIKNLTVADGQVASGTAGQIVAGPSNHARRMNLIFANVGGQEETLVISLSRNGGTARRLKRVVLGADEQLEISGLPVNQSDSVLAVTSNAKSVDYVASIAGQDAPLTMHVYDDKGGLKTAPYIIEQLDAVVS